MQKKEILNTYQITKDDVERTKALAHIMTSKWQPGLVEFNDVMGDGLEGLCRAAQLFDESKGTSFWAYATPSVRGYMLNGFRKRFGEKRQKLALARADSLSITEDDGEKYGISHISHEVEDVDNTQSSYRTLWEKINNMDLGPMQKKILWLMSEGYSQADIARLMGKSDGNICNSVQGIRARFSKEELYELIAV